MHNIQAKILKLMNTEDISVLTLRDLAGKIGETGSPQKIKHHLDQLAKKGLIVVDKKNNSIKKISVGVDEKSNLVSLPILGNANCGQATFFAEDYVEGYLKVSKRILGNFIDRINNLFVLRAVGSSMNRARVENNTIEDGDYVIVDKEIKDPHEGDYVVSIIEGVANIKKIHIDNSNKQIILVSESNQDLSPIYIHQDDLDQYFIAGKVIKIMKQPDELTAFRDAGALDMLKELGPMSKEEHDYYMNL